MGRKPKNAPVEGDVVVESPIPSLDSLPPRMLDGKPNPAYFRRKYEIFNDTAHKHYEAQGEFPKGLDTALRSLERECQLAGIDPKGLHDTRSEIDKALDLLKLISETPEAIFEAQESDIHALSGAMDKADTLVREHIEGLLSKAESEWTPPASFPKPLRAGGKSSRASSSSETEPAPESPQSGSEGSGSTSATTAITKPDTSSGT